MTATLNCSLEVKAINGRQFEGHGSVFGNVDYHGDIVMPGAFKRTLSEHRKDDTLPAMLWMHKFDQVAGVWHEMKEDSKGLYVRGELAETTLGNEVKALLKMKAVRGMSIGYAATNTDYDRDGNRLLKEIYLQEVSIVTLGANPLAKVEAMKARLSASGEYVPTEREFERTLRDVGLSRNVARHICAKLFDSEPDSGMLPVSRLRDAENVDDDEAAAVLAALDRNSSRMVKAAFNR